MFRKLGAAILVISVALVGVGGPVTAKKKPSHALTFFLNWQGDCAGGGYLSLKSVASTGTPCALYMNTQAETHSFPATEGLPLVLNASETITLDFDMNTVYQVTAEFEATLTGTVKGDRQTIASAAQVIPPQAGGTTIVHFDLEPDAKLNGKRFTDLSLTVALKSGYSYSTMNTSTGTLVIHTK